MKPVEPFQDDNEPALDPTRQAKARSYAQKTRLLYVLDAATAVALLAVLAFSGFSRSAAAVLRFPAPLSAAALFAAILLSYAVVTLPASYYRGFALPHRYGLGTQRVGAWLAERGRRWLLASLMGSAITAFAYRAMEAFPDLWWLPAGALVLSVTVVLNLLAPVAIMPLFFRCSPVRDEELSRRLTGLARRAGTKILGVFTIDQSRRSTTANAMLIGLGRARRIVLSDTLSHSYNPQEIETIMAHELGHHMHHDIPRLITLQSALGLIGFLVGHLVLRAAAGQLGLHAASDVAGLPLLVLTLMVFWLAMGPFTGAYIRRLERMADACALRLTGDAGAFISLMTKLANQNLNEADPGRWAKLLFYDHPPYRERVGQARRYREQALKERAPC